MNHVTFSKDLFESTPDLRKIVLILFLFKNDVDILHECSYLKTDINWLCLEFDKLSMEDNEEELNYFENEAEATSETILNEIYAFTFCHND